MDKSADIIVPLRLRLYLHIEQHKKFIRNIWSLFEPYNEKETMHTLKFHLLLCNSFSSYMQFSYTIFIIQEKMQ